MRVGVQFAQSYGVRVHLIGIANEHDRNHQSLSLIQEADTHTEWSADVINSFLSIRQPASRPARASLPPIEVASSPAVNEEPLTSEAAIARLEAHVQTLVDELVPNDLQGLKGVLKSSNSLPREFDGRLLGTCRDILQRDLEQPEKRFARKKFIELVRAK